jgi:hypothetical protein
MAEETPAGLTLWPGMVSLENRTHTFRTASFSFAFLLLTHWFGIMRDFAGQALESFGNETVTLRNQSVPKSGVSRKRSISWFCLYFS